MRIVFFGTGAVSTAYLATLLDGGFDVVAVVTKPPKRRARNGPLEPTPVAQIGVQAGLTVVTALDELGDLAFDLGVVVSYGRILPAALVEAHPLLNVHYSLLPFFRGAAPVERSVLAGGLASGVTLMRLVQEMDAGPVYAREPVEIDGRSVSEAYELLTTMGCQLMSDWLTRRDHWLEEAAQPQVGTVTYAPKITDGDLLVRSYESALQGYRRHLLERAYFYAGPKRIRLIKAHVEEGETGSSLGTIAEGKIQTAKGLLVPELVRPEGRSTMSFADFLRGSSAERISTHPEQ
ncbi:methionyl-tRNA formyltransferase [Ferrimicrobium sp.]|uniref:methionyl-tRNA formyltransferase n=1 Tax=Ferrimicrobium sp. TaxID=2926050 RepID=UPI00260F9451|nr:methionyl-tRNA formyltransferase [Ferrimicrobium sp.]